MNISIIKKLPVPILISLFLGSCADPLTKSMKSLGYRTAIPTPAQAHIGDIYSRPDFRSPHQLIRHHFNPNEIENLMQPLQTAVAVPNSSGESSYKISASADIISYVKADIEASGARKFKVYYSGVTEYVVPETYFEDIVYPAIKQRNPTRNYSGKYVVTGLLQVGALEYEFFNENGAKVNIIPGTEIANKITSKLGAEWKINNKNNLSFSQPMFLGYRMGKLSDHNFEYAPHSPTFHDGTSPSGVAVRELSRNEMDRIISELD